MANILPQVRYSVINCLLVVERLLVLSESRNPGQTANASVSIDSGSQQQTMMTPDRPELHVVPATPVDSVAPFSRPQSGTVVHFASSLR